MSVGKHNIDAAGVRGDVGNNNASGVSDKDGKFALKAFEEKSGAVPGSYKVSISKTIAERGSGKEGEVGVNLKYGLPQNYSDFLKSGLTFTLGPGGDKNIKFDLKSK